MITLMNGLRPFTKSMTTLELRYRDAIYPITLLNKWDIKGYETVRCKDVEYNDIGKLLEFDDGSEWYTPIVAVSGYAVRTDAGLFNKRDIVCVSRIKVPGAQYSGLYRNDQHLLVFPPTRKESERVSQFLAGQFGGKLSKRELMITTERLQEVCTKKSIDEDWIIKRLIREADNDRNKGFERLEAVKIIARVMGVEIATPVLQGHLGQQPLFGNVNILSIQDQRRNERQMQSALQHMVNVVTGGNPEKEEVIVDAESK